MRFTQIMHKEAYLLNNIGNIKASKGEILQGTNETLMESGVMD